MTQRSNSLDFLPAGDVARAPAEPCPICTDDELFARVRAWAPERALLVRLRDRMRLFVTDSSDYQSQELERIKSDAQLYVDRSRKIAPDDFARDLGKLEELAECASCTRAVQCPRAFAAAHRNVFLEDDARTRECLRRIRGRVLDVGAGDAPYASCLEGASREGRLEYLAIDPDGERLRLLARRCPWAETRVGSVDDLDGPARFDHVLFLRSLNHVPNPDVVLARAVSLLVAGGELLAVDDVAFGLVRTAEQVDRARTRAPAFEHHQNWSAADAHACVGRLGLTLAERRDVTRGGSSQWLLRYVKREDRT